MPTRILFRQLKRTNLWLHKNC